jgi:serpin B
MERVDELNVESNFEYNKYKTVFEIANSIWINNQSSPLSSYIQKVNSFNPELQNVNFADTEKIVADINTWCKLKTHDMIEQVVTENSFTPNSKTVLVNAIYFESPWLEPWNISNDKTFNCFDETKEVKMIETVTPYYYENDKATAFGAVYKNGLLFIGILPKNNGEFTVSELSLKELLDSQTMDYDVTAKMPAFKFDNEVEGLVEALKDTGYGILFDSSVCMFSQMLENEPLFISDIIQIDAIEVDENGTKAAAATAVIMDTNSAIMEEPKTKDVVLDRPFVFLIYDPVMEQIVFLGKVVDPA